MRLFWRIAMKLIPLVVAGLVLSVNVAMGQDRQSESKNSADERIVEAISIERDRELSEWQFVDDGWKIVTDEEQPIRLVLHKRESNYQPPHRSPLHLALWKTTVKGKFQIDVEVKSTNADYGHRDAVVFFGYHGPDQFYYVHLAKAMDDHANQVFIVNRAARTKISLSTNQGVPWDDQWHHVRVIRDTESGSIAVYFDNMDEPIMTANDKTFVDGRIGVGTFDDTAEFRKVTITQKLP
jgi:hypothetical protein